MEIDTDRRRLEEAKIVRPDGAELRPQALEFVRAPSPGSGLSIGVGGGRWGGGGGVGTGVSVGIPVGGASDALEGHLVAWFPLDQAGTPPWRLHVKLAGIEPAVILVGGASSGAR
jgi:hypothetical protein